jgi:maltose/maltodextrin transport system substrate-binding protein
MKEYSVPVHPGRKDSTPFWNGFSYRFIYAPAFDFAEVPGAANYLFTVRQAEHDNMTKTMDYIGNGYRNFTAEEAAPGPGPYKEWSFKADSPQSALSPVWSKIPVGRTEVVVEGLDKSGKVIGQAGRRTFYRDFPFMGPYTDAPRGYHESAILTAVYFHKMPAIHHWLENTGPDLSYELNGYACKIYGATVRMECFLASQVPALREEALIIARNAAECMMGSAQPAGAPLEYFPATYYLDPLDKTTGEYYVHQINKGKTMFMEAVTSGHALLDLYNATGEKRYYDFAIHIANTYKRHQAEDGSWPVKVEFDTGVSVTPARSIPTPLLQLFVRLRDEYGLQDYEEARIRGEEWIKKNVLESFNFNGQFEDQPTESWQKYQDLTHAQANDFIAYLLNKENPTKKEIEQCVEMARFCEDQFTYWDTVVGPEGYKTMLTPCVFEQYNYQTPIDASNAEMANSFLSLYSVTGDKLALAKGKALMDSAVKSQSPLTGILSTKWFYNPEVPYSQRTHWINCAYMSVQVLERFARMTGEI